MEFEQIVALTAVFFMSIIIIIFFFTSKNTNNILPNGSEIEKLEGAILFNRLGLKGDHGCVVTLSLEMKNLNATECKIYGTLNNISNLFLIIKAVNDDEEKDILTVINKMMGTKVDNKDNMINSFENHRILFYQTEIGKLALIRQLKPQLHIDHDLSVCTKIAPHIRYVVLNNDNNDKCSNSIQNMKIIQNIQELLTITSP